MLTNSFYNPSYCDLNESTCHDQSRLRFVSGPYVGMYCYFSYYWILCCDTRQNDLWRIPLHSLAIIIILNTNVSNLLLKWDPPWWRRREVLYLQLSDKSKRRMHVKADGTCNGTNVYQFYLTRIGVFLKVAPRQFHIAHT